MIESRTVGSTEASGLDSDRNLPSPAITSTSHPSGTGQTCSDGLFVFISPFPPTFRGGTSQSAWTERLVAAGLGSEVLERGMGGVGMGAASGGLSKSLLTEPVS